MQEDVTMSSPYVLHPSKYIQNANSLSSQTTKHTIRHTQPNRTSEDMQQIRTEQNAAIIHSRASMQQQQKSNATLGMPSYRCKIPPTLKA